MRFSILGDRKSEGERKSALIAVLRRQGIHDQRVLDAIAAVPREQFVGSGQQNLAWANRALSIPHGQTISQPFVVALMTQALELTGSERVLEIGTGSGYQAAILARLAREVYTIERIPELAAMAAGRFEALGIQNITSTVGDGSRGWAEHASYDAIMVTAGARKPPPASFEQLRDNGGRMVMPVGWRFDQHLRLFCKRDGTLTSHDLGGVRFVPLIDESQEKDR